MDDNQWKRIALAIGWEYVQDAPAGYDCFSYGNHSGWWKKPDSEYWMCAKCMWENFPQWDHHHGPAVNMAVRLADKYGVKFRMVYIPENKIWQVDFTEYISFGQAKWQVDKIVFPGEDAFLPGSICKAVEELLDTKVGKL